MLPVNAIITAMNHQGTGPGFYFKMGHWNFFCKVSLHRKFHTQFVWYRLCSFILKYWPHKAHLQGGPYMMAAIFATDLVQSAAAVGD